MTDNVWLYVVGAIVVIMLSIWLSFEVSVNRTFVWAAHYRCPITGKIFRNNSHCTEPCPCHGEKKVCVIARWRIRGWQIKEEARDAELQELRRIAGMK